MKLAFTIYLFFLLIIAQGQPNIHWQKCFGGSNNDIPNKVIKTRQGGFTIAGNSYSSNGQVSGHHTGLCSGLECSDYWIVKTDSLGNLLWENSYGGSNDDIAYSIAQTFDGGAIVIGRTSSNDGDVIGNHGSADTWVIKLDSLGNLLWQKCYGGSESDWGIDIIETYDQGYILSSFSRSTDGDVPGNNGNPTTSDIWLVKIDSIGNILWSRNYGGIGDDYPLSIIQSMDSGYAFLGIAWGPGGDISGHHLSSDFWLGRLDRDGNFLWGNCFGGYRQDQGNELKQTPDSGFILVGTTNSNDGDVSFNHNINANDIWVVKTDKLGNKEWEKSFGGTDYDLGISVLVADTGYLILGWATSNDGDVSGNHGFMATDSYLIKIDSIGNILWSKCYGGGGYETSAQLIEASDHEYVILSSTNSNSGDVSGNHGGEDFWLAKLFEPSASEAAINLKPIYGSCTLTDTEEVILQITNLGIQDFSNFQASYSINGGNPVQEIISDTIYPGDTMLYRFITRADFSLPGTYTLQANVIVAGDGHAFNDVSTINVTSISHNTVPMIMGFESQEYFGAYKSIDLDGDGRSGSLDQGYPNNGSQCYVFASSFLPNPNNWLWTPCIDLNALTNYKVSGWMKEYEILQPYNLDVYINQDPDTTGAILLGTVLTPTDSSYHPFQFPFTVSSSGVWYIGLKAYAQNYAQAVLLDDLVIDLMTGIQMQRGIERYILYPNPASEKSILTGDLKGKQIKMYDMLGKLINETQAFQNELEILLHGLNPGMYILSIDNTARIKLLKEY